MRPRDRLNMEGNLVLISKETIASSKSPSSKRLSAGAKGTALIGLVVSVLLIGIQAGPGEAATSPTLAAAASYSVLAGQTVTNTGPTTMNRSLGVSPGSAVTGFPPGVVGPPGTIHAGDASAANAQLDNSAA